MEFVLIMSIVLGVFAAGVLSGQIIESNRHKCKHENLGRLALQRYRARKHYYRMYSKHPGTVRWAKAQAKLQRLGREVDKLCEEIGR